jgi:uncharacterized protein (DUF1330 family)
MAIYPRPDQIQDLLKSKVSGPVEMLNLLKFKERAEYEDGRETSLTGREAYQLYAEKIVPFVIAKGGRLLHSAEAKLLMIGEGGLSWDMVAIVEYPSSQDFAKIIQEPEVAEFAVHRTAGLAHQLLIACSASGLT